MSQRAEAYLEVGKGTVRTRILGDREGRKWVFTEYTVGNRVYRSAPQPLELDDGPHEVRPLASAE